MVIKATLRNMGASVSSNVVLSFPIPSQHHIAIYTSMVDTMVATYLKNEPHVLKYLYNENDFCKVNPPQYAILTCRSYLIEVNNVYSLSEDVNSGIIAKWES